MDKTNSKKQLLYMALGTCIFLLSLLINQQITQTKKYTKEMTTLNKVFNPHEFDNIIFNYIFNNTQAQFELNKNKRNQKYFNDFISKQNYHYDLFYIKKWAQYCRANFLYTVLNQQNMFNNSLNLYTDYSQFNQLRRRLQKKYLLLNPNIRKYQNYTKEIVTKLQKQEWNPYTKLIFTNTNLLYNHQIGKSYFCMFQQANFSPGVSYLHRSDLIYDQLIAFQEKESNRMCYNTNKILIQGYWLYDKNECELFFNQSETKKFKNNLKNKIRFLIRNLEENLVEILDQSEMRKLNKQYQSGKQCGKIKKKYIIQKYINKQLRYKNEKKFVIRSYMIISSTNPVEVLFYKGEVHLEWLTKDQTFSNSQISLQQLEQYQIDQKLWKQDTLKTIMKRIEKHLSFLAIQNKNKVLKDHWFYQIIAYDFIINQRNEAKLFNQISNPYFSNKNFGFVNQVINLQNQIFNEKSNMILNEIQKIKYNTYHQLQQQSKKFKYLEELVQFLDEHIKLDSFKEKIYQLHKQQSLEEIFSQYKKFSTIFSEKWDFETINIKLQGICHLITS